MNGASQAGASGESLKQACHQSVCGMSLANNPFLGILVHEISVLAKPFGWVQTQSSVVLGKHRVLLSCAEVPSMLRATSWRVPTGGGNGPRASATWGVWALSC